MRFIKSFGFVLFLIISSVQAQTPADSKKENNKIQEVVVLQQMPVAVEGEPVDTSIHAPQPITSSEVLKRAINWVKMETPKFEKAVGVTTGSKAECTATFKYKPKELNPQSDVEGTITMHVSIEAKENKYRYTITKITHTSKNSAFTGGDIYQEVPQCGSMKMSNELWKRIKSEALKDTNILVNDLKDSMQQSSEVPMNPDEW